MKNLNEFLKQSNYIEGVYDKQSLVDARKAWDFIVKYDNLSLNLICQTHNELMINQSLEGKYKGQLRDCGVSVGGRICPHPEVIKSKLSFWVDFANDMPKTSKQTVRDHVTFEKIHPFADGNGRIGRILMLWQTIKSGLPILVIKESEKHEYYEWFEDDDVTELDRETQKELYNNLWNMMIDT